jgi:AcrR family transcriptional regulator
MDTLTAILDAAAALLEDQGPDALTTRAVCEAAGVKAPTLYHYFGGKGGLEQAVLERGMAEFMRRKRVPPESADALEQLWSGWNISVEFALSRPALWRLYSQRAITHPEVCTEGYALMQARVQRLVDMGRFRGPVDVASTAVWAACQGVLALVLQGRSAREVKAMSELMFRAITAQLGNDAHDKARQ